MTRFVPGEPVQLETPRFWLKSLNPDMNLDDYLVWVNDPEVNRFLEVRLSKSTPESLRSYIGWHDDVDSFMLGIFTKAENRHIGNYSLVVSPDHKRASLGVMIGDKSFWGKSVVGETRAAVLDFAFNYLDLFKVHSVVYSKNNPAIFNFLSQVWTVDGISKKHCVMTDGERSDMVHFAMFRDNWLNRGEGR